MFSQQIYGLGFSFPTPNMTVNRFRPQFSCGRLVHTTYSEMVCYPNADIHLFYTSACSASTYFLSSGAKRKTIADAMKSMTITPIP